jgi:hypothetical protein
VSSQAGIPVARQLPEVAPVLPRQQQGPGAAVAAPRCAEALAALRCAAGAGALVAALPPLPREEAVPRAASAAPAAASAWRPEAALEAWQLPGALAVQADAQRWVPEAPAQRQAV